jgi:hypothetical protein
LWFEVEDFLEDSAEGGEADACGLVYFCQRLEDAP